jgi:hypothetical protein
MERLPDRHIEVKLWPHLLGVQFMRQVDLER